MIAGTRLSGAHREAGTPVELPGEIAGELTMPPEARGVVVFALGDGALREGPAQRTLATALAAAHVGTLRFDLLSSEERAARPVGADVFLFARRLEAVTRWTEHYPVTARLPIGYVASDVGGAAALRAAAEFGDRVATMVLAGARTDLAGEALARVTAPTLFLVGGADPVTLNQNAAAMREMPGLHELVIVPHAGHRFAESGAMSELLRLSADWIVRFIDGHVRRRVSRDMSRPV